MTCGYQECLAPRLATSTCSHSEKLASCQSFPLGHEHKELLHTAIPHAPNCPHGGLSLAYWPGNVALWHVLRCHRNSPAGGRAALGMGCSCQAARRATNHSCCRNSMSLIVRSQSVEWTAWEAGGLGCWGTPQQQ